MKPAMSGSRSRRRRKRAAAKRDGKATATRPASDSARRRSGATASTPVVAEATKEAKDAKDARDADVAALRSEIRALKRALAIAEEKANDADAKRSRAVNRATAALRRENESLEAQLTLLVQEIGQIKHLIDRVPKLETELRARDLQIAERERAWLAERTELEAEIARLRGLTVEKGASGAKAMAAAAGVRAESVG
jgi:chromosome segregation ATPase